MFWGIFNAIIGLVNTFLYKRATDSCVKDGFSTAFRTFVMNFCVFVIVVPLSIVFFRFLGLEDSWNVLTLSDALFFCGIGVLSTFSGFTGQYAYANEKVSVLAPFSQVSWMVTIIFGFLFLSGGSMIAFIAAIIASLAIFFSSVDFRSFTLNRYTFTLLIGWFFSAASNLMTADLVMRYSSFSLIVARAVVELIISLWLIAVVKDFVMPTKHQIQGSYLAFTLNDIVWLMTYAIGLFLIKDLGIIFASLIGMFSLIATIGLAWFMEKRRPETKSLIVAGVVSVCIIFAGIYG